MMVLPVASLSGGQQPSSLSGALARAQRWPGPLGFARSLRPFALYALRRTEAVQGAKGGAHPGCTPRVHPKGFPKG